MAVFEKKALETHWLSKIEQNCQSYFPPFLALQFSPLILLFSLCAALCGSILINSVTWNNEAEQDSNPELNANLAAEKWI